MITRAVIAAFTMAACVAVHAIGSLAGLRWLHRTRAFDVTRFWPATGLLISVAGGLVSMHLVDVALWAFLYTGGHALPDLEVALYFSAATYTTVGYGDIVLPPGWRLVGGIEALTGILMCGWSTGGFFSVVSRITPPHTSFASPDVPAREPYLVRAKRDR